MRLNLLFFGISPLEADVRLTPAAIHPCECSPLPSRPSKKGHMGTMRVQQGVR